MLMAGLSTRCHCPTRTLSWTGVLREHDKHRANAAQPNTCAHFGMARLIHPNKNTERMKRLQVSSNAELSRSRRS